MTLGMACFSTGASYSYVYTILLFAVILPLFYTTVSTKSVYYVRPDNEGFLENNSSSAHTLSDYLLNASDYFTSNTELKFLSGLYCLDAVIMIKDIDHFSLTGNSRNGTIDSIVECAQYKFGGGIVIINSSYINIQDLILKDCNTGLDYPLYLKGGIVSGSYYVSLLINNSHTLNICHVTTQWISFYNIALINVFNSSLNNISSNGMAVIYNNAVDKNYSSITNNNKLLIHVYNSVFSSYNFTPYEMVLNFIQYSSGVQVQISNVQYKSDKAMFVYSYASTACNGINKVSFINCSLNDIKCVEKSDEQDSIITIIVDNYLCSFHDNKQTNLITFMNCSFSNNVNTKALTKYIIKFQNTNSDSLLHIVNSQFCNNDGTIILTSTTKFNPLQYIFAIYSWYAFICDH